MISKKCDNYDLQKQFISVTVHSRYMWNAILEAPDLIRYTTVNKFFKVKTRDYDGRKAVAPCGEVWNPRSLCFDFYREHERKDILMKNVNRNLGQ